MEPSPLLKIGDSIRLYMADGFVGLARQGGLMGASHVEMENNDEHKQEMGEDTMFLDGEISRSASVCMLRGTVSVAETNGGRRKRGILSAGSYPGAENVLKTVCSLPQS